MKLLNERFQPCCGFFLQGAVRWISFLNLIMLVVGLGLLALDVFQLWGKWQIEKKENVTDYYIRLGLWLAYVVHVLISIPIDISLFKASRTKNIWLLKMFVFSSVPNTTYALLVYWTHTFKFGIHLPTLTVYNGYLVYKYYVCLVVYYFLKEAQEDEEMASAKRGLTDAEIAEFEYGLQQPPIDLETKSLMEKVLYQRYKKEDCEVELDKLQFDMGNPLGSGAYGTVYKAQLQGKDGYETTVAVKTTDPEETDIVYFKAILSEMKIMSYVGKHQNVVNLIGACTAEIRKRKLYILLEFCAYGNLYTFLRGSRGTFNNLVRNQILRKANTDYDKNPFGDDEGISTEDLIKFSYEIASGMEFLESRKVCHGDLALRNILLTGQKVVKITDFGLARQLYSYSVYVKKQNVPLPWRWLSLESMTDMNFSSASDVWSYAVTLWEMFTLAEVPWQGYDFNLMFVENLKRGLRLNIPQYATDEIFKIMVQCWHAIPAQRPNFNHIAAFFYEYYQMHFPKSPRLEIQQSYKTCVTQADVINDGFKSKETDV